MVFLVYILVHFICNNIPTSRIPFCTDAIQFPICLPSNMGAHVGNVVVMSNTHPVYWNTGPGELCICLSDSSPFVSLALHHHRLVGSSVLKLGSPLANTLDLPEDRHGS